MRRLPVPVLVLAALAFPPAASASPLIETAPLVFESTTARPTLVVDPLLVERTETRGVGSENYVTVDLFIGAPMGVRAAFFPYHTDDFGVSVEVIYGGNITTAGIMENVAGAVGVHFTVASDGVNDAFIIAPGINFYVGWDDSPDSGWIDFGPDSTVYLLTTNAELMWVHDFARHFGLEIGLRLGGGVFLGGLDNNSEDVAGRLTPELALFIGFRF